MRGQKQCFPATLWPVLSGQDFGCGCQGFTSSAVTLTEKQSAAHNGGGFPIKRPCISPAPAYTGSVGLLQLPGGSLGTTVLVASTAEMIFGERGSKGPASLWILQRRKGPLAIAERFPEKNHPSPPAFSPACTPLQGRGNKGQGGNKKRRGLPPASSLVLITILFYSVTACWGHSPSPCQQL